MSVKRLSILVFTLCLAALPSVGQDVKDSVEIFFRGGQSRLNPAYRNNAAILDSMIQLVQRRITAPDINLKKLEITGRTSPEGVPSFNRMLAERRAAVLTEYVRRHASLPDSLLVLNYYVSDWHTVSDLISEHSDFPHRTEFLSALQNVLEKETGNETDTLLYNGLRQIKQGIPYWYMYHNIFPFLRTATFSVTYARKVVPVQQKESVAPVAEPQPSPEPSPEPHVVEDTVSVAVPQKPFFMSLRTNLLYDALLVPNLGAEFYLGKGMSVAANWHYAWWDTDSWYWRTYGGELAVRKWIGKAAKEKPLTGHHIGVYGQALTYDFMAFGNKGFMSGEPGDNLFDRASYAVGVEYGYSLPLARRLNLDFVLGVGYQGGKYNEYRMIDNCYVWQALKKRSFFGPTKAEITLAWQLGRGNVNVKKGGSR